jgi:hypothetical protein
MTAASSIRLGVLAALGVFLWAIPSAVAAAEPEAELTRAFVRDAEVTAHFRTYYLDRDKPDGSVSAAWAAGGWLGYESGWLANLFQVGVVGYTSQPLWAPDEKDGTLLLKPGQEGYTVLGQAYGSLKLWDQVFTGYRQWVNEPEVNPQDNRMTPNTFEGYTLAGKVGAVEYFGGYLTKMKKRNADSFVDLASAAGAVRGGSEQMYLAGVRVSPQKDLALRLSAYQVPNILSSLYADVAWQTPLRDDFKLRLGAQYMTQRSAGDDFLTGFAFDTWSAGAKADLIRGGATLSLAYNQTGTGAAYLSPYGTWAGYTSMIVRDFDRAGEKAFLIGGTYDFAALDVPGLVLNVAAVFGRDAIDPVTRQGIADENEYDVTLDYRFTSKQWPEWLRPLWIRARGVRVEDKLGGTTDVTTDYRIIVNYEWVFK